MPIRVVIVDDDVWIRRGRAEALRGVPGVEVVAALAHDDALGRHDLWTNTDVVLVDAWDVRADFDRFPGVGVVRAIRSEAGDTGPRIVVVTGHVLNDLLRLRMADAGADLFYGHEDVGDHDRLAAVVLGAASTPVAPRPAGVPVRAEEALDWIREHHVEEAFSGPGQKSLPFSRRTIARIRREVSGRARLVPSGQMAKWRAVVDFVNRARGAELRRPPDHLEDPGSAR